MFPQPQQRAEIFEYPVTEMSFIELLTRRLNQQRDYVSRITINLNLWKQRRKETPQRVIDGTNPQTGAKEQITITKLVKDSMEEVRNAVDNMRHIENLIAMAKAGTIEENWNAEALTEPLEVFPDMGGADLGGGQRVPVGKKS